MTTLGQQRSISPESPQAAHGRFFDGSTPISAENLFELSHEFYGIHGDLFNGQVGLVLQAGVTEAGGYVDLNDRKDNSHTMVTSVIFDAQYSSRGVYGWQITKAEIGAGREVFKLGSVQGFSLAVQGSFDSRGAMYSRKTDAEANDRALAALSGALGCGLVGARISELYQQKQDAEVALRQFAVGAIRKHNPTRHKEKVAEAEKSIERISFPVLGPTDLYINYLRQQ